MYKNFSSPLSFMLIEKNILERVDSFLFNGVRIKSQETFSRGKNKLNLSMRE